MQSVTHFHSCVFELKRRGTQFIEGFPLGSGFDIQLTYAHKVQLDGDILGLNDDFDLSPLLAKFLHMNQHLINDRIEVVESALWRYRKTARKEARRKRKALSYGFTTEVWNWPAPPDEAAKTVEGLERDLRVRHLILEREDALLAAKERMDGVGQSEIATWWYLFWVRLLLSTMSRMYSHPQPAFLRTISGGKTILRIPVWRNTLRILIPTIQHPLHTVHYQGQRWKPS